MGKAVDAGNVGYDGYKLY